MAQPCADSSMQEYASLVRKNKKLRRKRRQQETAAYWRTLITIVWKAVRMLERYGQAATPVAVCYELGIRVDVLEKALARDTWLRRRMKEELGYRSRCRSAVRMLQMEGKKVSIVGILRIAKLGETEKRIFRNDVPLRHELGILPRFTTRPQVKCPTFSDIVGLEAAE